MEDKMNNYDIKNLIIRFFSAVFFVPCIILPIVLKGYIIYLFYIFLLALMVLELIDMIKISKTLQLFHYLNLQICSNFKLPPSLFVR